MTPVVVPRPPRRSIRLRVDGVRTHHVVLTAGQALRLRLALLLRQGGRA